MSTYEQAERVRDMIADRLLDGVRVVSVGIENDGSDYRVGVTATRDVALPTLPTDLQDVPVNVVLTSRPAQRQNLESGAHTEGSSHSRFRIHAHGDRRPGHRLNTVRGWWNRLV